MECFAISLKNEIIDFEGGYIPVFGNRLKDGGLWNNIFVNLKSKK